MKKARKGLWMALASIALLCEGGMLSTRPSVTVALLGLLCAMVGGGIAGYLGAELDYITLIANRKKGE